MTPQNGISKKLQICEIYETDNEYFFNIFFDLQVHKSVVRGRSHLNVSAVMKKVPSEATVKVIALRHQNNMEKIAVKKFTQFPVKLDDVVRKYFSLGSL